ncbi:MAG: hydroxymethylglutaryl-CoA synthase [Proteobacteria bacterium]|nr:hydroxymethylglutaryl-CoA synthase [Pseudomonadota bacterium]
MAGITSICAYIPRYRLSLEEIGRMWQTRGGAGEKAIAGYDEDAVTMAVAASLACMKRSGGDVDSLYLATVTAPYKEKQSAAFVAGAADLYKTCHTADFTNTLRAGTTAVKAAVDAVKSGSARQVLVVASDCRMGAPKGKFEQLLGDGAAAVMIGSDNVIANIEGTHSIFSDFTDLWRTEKDTFIQSGEGRFIDEAGYMPVMKEVITELMEKYSLTSGDFTKIVFYAPDSRAHANLAKTIGFSKDQVQDPLFGQIGNTGTAAAMIMLAAALEEATPGDRILFAGYGDGADVFILRVTDSISRIKSAPSMKSMLKKGVPVDYGRYLIWRNLVPVEPSGLPERAEPSLAARWRERKTIRALYGAKCRKCGTPQIHPIGQISRVCVTCQTKDDFEDYKFSDKTGRLFTYAIDQLQPTLNPPGLNGVIDFDGGGRLICELTDYDLSKVDTGMPVDMTFRKLSQGKGIINYFWKAKPI